MCCTSCNTHGTVTIATLTHDTVTIATLTHGTVTIATLTHGTVTIATLKTQCSNYSISNTLYNTIETLAAKYIVLNHGNT